MLQPHERVRETAYPLGLRRVTPGYGIWKVQALFDQKFQPERRKSIASELRTSSYLSILLNDPRACDCLYLPFQHPIHDKDRRNSLWLDRSGHENVCIQDD
jgi:hypothetical protein